MEEGFDELTGCNSRDIVVGTRRPPYHSPKQRPSSLLYLGSELPETASTLGEASAETVAVRLCDYRRGCLWDPRPDYLVLAHVVDSHSTPSNAALFLFFSIE